MSLHPIRTTERLRQTYIRYLKTIKPFRDPQLHSELARALEAPNLLVKGPLIEASPPFRTGRSIADLVAEGLLHPNFRQLDAGLPYYRPLYTHQERAVRKGLAGRNLIVATGTGSGKTETFLIPILNHLLKEAEQGTLSIPGVRALLLYPMNALANDQMRRLRNILHHYSSITFGRYVGNTPYTEKGAKKQFERLFPGEPWLENELHSREAMRSRPPHILLTNYAMLEYLLLRPDDSPFFDGPTAQFWRFIVLDEVHVYTGAKATEVAMLLRRLLDRVTNGHPERVQAIATSATLGRAKEEHFRRMARFASDLFGLPFEWMRDDPTRQDVVVAERLSLSGLDQPWGQGTPKLYTILAKLSEQYRAGKFEEWPEHISGVPIEVYRKAKEQSTGDGGFARGLFFILRGDQRLHLLRERLQSGPQDFRSLAKEIFPALDTEDAYEALNALVSVAIVAREDSTSAPLLPARYHVFARALEGAFVCLNTAHAAHSKQKKPRLFLQRHRTCPHCGGRVFELATCTQCGAAYLVGKLTGDANQGELEHSSVIHDHSVAAKGPVYFSLESFRPQEVDEDALLNAEVESESEEEEAKQPDVGAEELDPYWLCPRCGHAWPRDWSRPCSCDVEPVLVNRVDLGRSKVLRRCIHCSTTHHKGAVYRFLTSRDAVVSLLLQTLYRDLPEGQGEALHKPGVGRKLISFADSRQAAAFFAPYLERVAQREMRRQLIVRALRSLLENGYPNPGLEDVLPAVKQQAEEAGVFTEADQRLHRERTIAAWLLAEFRPIDRRLSLEGVGLVRFAPFSPPKEWRPLERLLRSPWNLSPHEVYQLFVVLLNTMRYQGAVTPLKPVPLGDPVTDTEFLFLFWPRAKPSYIQEQHSRNTSNYTVYSWLPRRAGNARLNYLVRLLAKRGLPQEARRKEALDALHEIWIYLVGRNSPWPNILQEKRLPYRRGIAYQINSRAWYLQLTEQDEDLRNWWGCDRCGFIAPFQVENICPTYGCNGNLRPLSELPEAWQHNLYRFAYTQLEPVPLKVEEHTAQWIPEVAAEVQQKFLRGEINVLSCSTTFELGVDLGDLQSVVMHNMPPQTANYVQRAGRAGRRTDAVAYVLTFAQRRSHDLHFYHAPERMVAGEIRPPVVSLHNDKVIRRHVHSVALSYFFRWLKEEHGIPFNRYKEAGAFFEDETHNGIDGVIRLEAYLAQRPPELLSALQRIVPRTSGLDLHNILGITDWSWVSHLVNRGPEKGLLNLAAEEVRGELRLFRELENRKAAQRDYHRAEQYQHIQNQIWKRSLLNYLGSRNVLPKYGFPTDVVPLRTDHLITPPEAAKIQLERDLRMAISEFAPGGQVVAGKHVWRSQGIYRLPEREWVPYSYAICPRCGRLQIQASDEPVTESMRCVCGELLPKQKWFPFFVPELGFIAARETRRPGEEPPRRIYAEEIRFADYHVPDPQTGGPGKELHRPEYEVVEALSYKETFIKKAYSRYGWLVVINSGYGRGFYVCSACGYAEAVALKKQSSTTHNNPKTGEKCTGTLKRWHLGHRFMTDVLEVQFHFGTSTPLYRIFREDLEGTAYSVLYALLEGASRALDIPREDISGTFYFPKGQNQSPFSVVFVDAVPGGAGHAAHIREHLAEIFEEAFQVVDACECGEDTSCYNCLRSYDNQWHHDILKRSLAKRTLEPFVLNRTPKG